MNRNNRRFRAVNWTEEEKQIFCSVLKQRNFVYVTECKAIGGKTVKVRQKAWGKIYTRFNKLNGRHRPLIQLKLQWKKMKSRAQRKNTFRIFVKEPTEPCGLRATDEIMADEIKYILNHADDLLTEDNIYNTDDIDLKLMMYADACLNNHNTSENHQETTDCDLIRSMASHIKMLNEKEQTRRLEMAEEEHSINIAIQKEQLKIAALERDILELRKAREHDNFDLSL